MKQIIENLKCELNILVTNYKSLQNEIRITESAVRDFWKMECRKCLSEEEQEENYLRLSKKYDECQQKACQMRLAIQNLNNSINNLRVANGESYKVLDEKNYTL